MIDQASEQIQKLVHKIKNDEGIHEELPGGSLIHLDRPMPFICIYRFPKEEKKTPEATLLSTQVAYLYLRDKDTPLIKDFLCDLAESMQKRFGAFLMLEIWQAQDQKGIELVSADDTNEQFLGTLQKELSQFPLSIVQQVTTTDHFPETNTPLLPRHMLKEETVRALGMQLSPFYWNNENKRLYPMIYRQFRKELSVALRKFFYDFVRVQTRMEVAHYNSLGRQKVGDVAWKIDQELVKIGNTFDFLLLTSVVNHNEAWEEFRRGGFNQQPTFLYRLIPVDPELLKRRLYQVPIEELDDPTLAFIFRDKRRELDRMLNMLEERNTRDFHLSSIQVFGGVEEELLAKANQILDYQVEEKEEDEDEEPQATERISTEEFVALARQEISWMQQQYKPLDATVTIRNDITGLMVSRGQLLVGSGFTTTRKRADALIQHEVGTHVLTYYNGKAQPLQQMYVGSPGYEDLQEGLAVLAEYLVGGLTLSRLRTLAGRVVAVDCMLHNADFSETFHVLHRDKGFTAYTAYGITERVYRGGGMTKDAVYLRGLLHLLDHLAQGNELQPLLIGKIRQDYLPIIDELIQRKILKPAPIVPRYFSNPVSMERLRRLQTKTDVLSLLN
ncbi:flavohemoglobin expression-modulating QEGLA motif protein [Cesiribacter sp. SM1]|uniref:flavohemoglobin expression-modulating QEGLA motif protein n=1 Tax=Cesiribacter sp. SM1 TaxID=2861196 RepID=UPI001CD7D825|nr:tyrosine/phenylalanine carboxypeptidase domain-containing protein [Cesiribacter sp. SM1]